MSAYIKYFINVKLFIFFSAERFEHANLALQIGSIIIIPQHISDTICIRSDNGQGFKMFA
ncbi:hypothetical protein D3C75_685580 [compost metagenome]